MAEGGSEDIVEEFSSLDMGPAWPESASGLARQNRRLVMKCDTLEAEVKDLKRTQLTDDARSKPTKLYMGQCQNSGQFVSLGFYRKRIRCLKA
jgi:hypothetical protein